MPRETSRTCFYRDPTTARPSSSPPTGPSTGSKARTTSGCWRATAAWRRRDRDHRAERGRVDRYQRAPDQSDRAAPTPPPTLVIAFFERVTKWLSHLRPRSRKRQRLADSGPKTNRAHRNPCLVWTTSSMASALRSRCRRTARSRPRSRRSSRGASPDWSAAPSIQRRDASDGIATATPTQPCSPRNSHRLRCRRLLRRSRSQRPRRRPPAGPASATCKSFHAARRDFHSNGFRPAGRNRRSSSAAASTSSSKG